MTRIKHIFYILGTCTIASLLLSGCGTQNKFASSFGKRKYNKGYYWNTPGTIVTPMEQQVVASENVKSPIQLKITVKEPSKPVVLVTTVPFIEKVNKASSPQIVVAKSQTSQSVSKATAIKSVNGIKTIEQVSSYHHQESNSDQYNGLAIASLITGLFLNLFGLPIILGVIALNQLKTNPEKGQGMAIAGIVLGAIGLLIEIIAITFILSFA